MLKSAIQIEAAARLGPFIRAANIALTVLAILALLSVAAIASLFAKREPPDERPVPEPDAA